MGMIFAPRSSDKDMRGKQASIWGKPSQWLSVEGPWNNMLVLDRLSLSQ